jgi:hypothetical protein
VQILVHFSGSILKGRRPGVGSFRAKVVGWGGEFWGIVCIGAGLNGAI